MKKNVALVLSSGGARGFAHIGVINILEQNGYNITSIAGTSMGALVGGIYATGRLKEFQEWVSDLDKREVIRLVDLTISTRGLVKGKKIIEKIKEIVPERNIEDLEIPFCAVATDIINGTEKVFRTGNLYDAIRASISIPTVFQPFKIGSDYYVDGGVINPIPINRVARQDNDLVIVSAVNADIPDNNRGVTIQENENGKHLKQLKLLQTKLNKHIPGNRKDDVGIFNLTNRSISIMLNQIGALTLEKHKIDLMIRISRDAYGTYDFHKAREIISEGEEAARKAFALTEK